MTSLRFKFPPVRAGFSLIEIILALGIISFALVGILGLFPVAVAAASNSQQETQAALIARSIFEQLESTPETPIRYINIAQTLDKQSPSPIKVDLANADSSISIGFDIEGQPLASSSDPNAIYRAELNVSPMPVPANALSQVTVTIKSKTASYPFTSLLRQK